MNVEVESLPNCMTTLRVELEPERVAKTWDQIAGDYGRYAKIPGYRPGKAPRGIVEKKFQKEIREEVKNRLLSESCREAISSKNLKVLSVADIEDFELGEDKSMRFTATLVTQPEFELPEYKGIPVKVKPAEVSETEVNDFIEVMRDRSADFADFPPDAELAMDLFGVIDFSGKIEGKPVEEIVPRSGKHLTQGTNFWLRMSPQTFLPGFCEQLTGMKIGEFRSFAIDLPADFTVKELAGKKLDYEITLRGIKRKILPELNAEFFQRFVPDSDLEKFRAAVRGRLEGEKASAIDHDRRSQIMNTLLQGVECELPPNMVRSETRHILSDLVRENQSRGVPDDAIRENQKELLESATQSARDKLKGTFILLRIADQEKITVSKEELQNRYALMAAQSGVTVEKLRRELESRDALAQVEEELLTGKALDFLDSNATVTTDSQP